MGSLRNDTERKGYNMHNRRMQQPELCMQPTDRSKRQKKQSSPASSMEQNARENKDLKGIATTSFPPVYALPNFYYIRAFPCREHYVISRGMNMPVTPHGGTANTSPPPSELTLPLLESTPRPPPVSSPNNPFTRLIRPTACSSCPNLATFSFSRCSS